MKRRTCKTSWVWIGDEIKNRQHAAVEDFRRMAETRSEITVKNHIFDNCIVLILSEFLVVVFTLASRRELENYSLLHNLFRIQ